MEILFKKISDDLQSAMKARDALRLDTLRMMKSKVLNVNAKGALPDAEIIKIISKYAKSLRDSIEEFKKGDRFDAIKKVEEELKIIGEYLPQQPSEDEIKLKVKNAVAELGATSAKEKGAVIKKVMSEIPGVDGGTVSRLTSEILK
jgi:hypothetical protein